jgi:hypothetical protein
MLPRGEAPAQGKGGTAGAAAAATAACCVAPNSPSTAPRQLPRSSSRPSRGWRGCCHGRDGDGDLEGAG